MTAVRIRVISVFAAVALTGILTSAVATVGCGGKNSRNAASVDKAKAGDLVTVEGMLSLRGNQPHPLIMLERNDGGVVVIQSSELQDELKVLSGMRVEIEGKVLPSIEDETPVVDVLRYRMLALPSGEVPIVGTLRLLDGACVLEATDGKRYWVRGDFTDIIMDFDGAKVWVVGSAGDLALPDKPDGTVPLWVTGYGVLSER